MLKNEKIHKLIVLVQLLRMGIEEKLSIEDTLDKLNIGRDVKARENRTFLQVASEAQELLCSMLKP